MSTALTIPTLLLLVGFPNFWNLPGLKLRRPRPPAVVDTLPPTWKTASRLALESQFVRGALPTLGPRAGLRIQNDPRSLQVSFHPDSGTLSLATHFGGVPVGGPAEQSVIAYSQELSRRTFQRQWAEESRKSINTLGVLTPSAPRTGLSFALPSPLPKRVQSLLGPGGPALSVSGSENITLSGQSNWTNQQVGPLGQKRSLFPSLDMQQDLNIRLEGQLSDRIKVNLLQNSAVQIPLANRIAINYKGDEDDLIQALDLGNTNLSLPGTQYVSYSGKNEGLFGIKAASRMGPLDLTILTSKQEGRSERASYAGGASRQTQTLRDLDYVKGVYFFLYDPDSTRGDTLAYDIPNQSIRLYLDDYNNYNDVNTVQARALVDPESLATASGPDSTRLGKGAVSVRGSFKLLNPGPDQDYEVLPDVYGPFWKVIWLKHQIGGEQRLAASYLKRPVVGGQPVGPYRRIGDEILPGRPDSLWTLKLIRPPASLIKPDPTGSIDDSLALTQVLDLELKNFYLLAGQNIDPATLQVSIRKGVDQPPVTYVTTPGDTTIPYLEILGLDNFDETTGTAVAGHDRKVDGVPLNPDTRKFVDYLNGTLFFYDLRPFAPRIAGASAGRFQQLKSASLLRRASLVGPTGSATEPNPAIYDKYNVQHDLDARYYIDVDFTAAKASGEITLGRGNIIEGSDVVTINGQALVRDRDYSVDYDLGRITLKRQLGAADRLNVDYSYAPLFQQAGRTLLGSAFRLEGRDRSLGGAFLYESRGAQDLRPRLGEEPSRSLIADLNSDWSFKPDWITRLVDRLPGIRTTSPSEFRVQAEMGSSFPNPNTRNEVYIDDMEGVRDAVSLSMGPERWRWSSVASRMVGAAKVPLTQIPALRNAEIHWYSPYSYVKEVDLKPTLEQAQGAQNSRQVLAFSIPRRPTTATPADSLWAGLTYSLDAAGLDLSKSQFIELWVDDFNDQHIAHNPVPRVRGRHVKLHIDLGTVSEDQMRAPNQPPNGALDTEDKPPRDNQLVVTPGKNEDTGVDGALDGAEPDTVLDLVTASGEDPQGDDFRAPLERLPDGRKLEEIDTRRYRFTNGTEDNKTLFPYPDTEDLIPDNSLNTAEQYFEYTIDLGDPASPYLVTDVRAKYVPGDPNVRKIPEEDNGWRRYRIPIADEARVQFGVPNLALAQHVRVWVEGVIDPDPDEAAVGIGPLRPLLLLGSLDIVGSRWRAADLDSAALADSATVTLNSVNTVDNADIYTAPFDPGRTVSGSQGLTRREQSFALEFTGLRPGGSVEAFRTFSLDEDYSRYGKLNWYVTGYQVTDASGLNADSLAYFVRFASDERGVNYYEYRAPLPGPTVNWQQVNLDLTELSGLKLDTRFAKKDSIYTERPGHPGDTLIVRGRPSFTRLRRISFGLVNRANAKRFTSGQLWFDELRARDIAKDRDLAQRVQVNGRMANLLSYNMSWDGRGADFLTVGESRGGGSSVGSLSLGGNLDLHRFFEATGIVLPVSFNFGRNSSRPRFSAGDDVVRSGAQAAASETYSSSSGWQTSYSRNWNARSNPLLLYTLGGITANLGATDSRGHNPNTVSQGHQVTAGLNYAISPRSLFSFGLPGTKARVFPLPERFYWNYSMRRSRNETADRLLDAGLASRTTVEGRAAGINFGGDTRPIELFHHHFEGVRNLALGDNTNHLGFIHLGRVVSWSQAMDSRYSLNRGPWLRPTLSWNANYSQNNGPELSKDLTVRSIVNGQSVGMNWTLPFDALAGRVSAVADSARAAARPAAWRSWLSRIGNLSTDAKASWSSSFNRMTGTPGLPYLFGLGRNPFYSGHNVASSFGNQASNGSDWRASARTRIILGLGASLQTSAEMGSQAQTRNNVGSQHDRYRFPDVQVDYGQVPTALRLDRFVRSPRLRTSFNNSSTVDFSQGSKASASTSSNWQPMLGLDGELRNGTRVEFSLERRITKTEAFQLGHSTRTQRFTDIKFGLNRSYSQGQKVSFLGRETTVKSSVNLGLSSAYSRESGETREDALGRSAEPRDVRRNDRLSVNGTGAYGFSNNVTGNLVLGFGQDRDLETAIVRRNVRVELRAAFTF